MFGVMGNLCYNLLTVDMCLNFGVLQNLASHQNPSLFKVAIASFDLIGNPDLVNAHILFVFKCERGSMLRYLI